MYTYTYIWKQQTVSQPQEPEEDQNWQLQVVREKSTRGKHNTLY